MLRDHIHAELRLQPEHRRQLIVNQENYSLALIWAPSYIDGFQTVPLT